MPNKTVPALPSASALAGTEPIETVQSGTSVKTTTQAIANLAPSAAAAVLVESGAAKKVSALTTAGALAGTETVPVVQGGTTKKTTVQDIADLAGGGDLPALLVESGGEEKISALSAAGALAGTEEVPVVQGGATKRTTAQAIADLAASGMTVRQESSTTYPLVLGDAGEYIQFTSGSPISLVIPTNTVAFAIGTTIIVEQNGGGAVTVSATGGVTLHSAGGLVASNGQYATFSLVKVATNTWTLMGNLA